MRIISRDLKYSVTAGALPWLDVLSASYPPAYFFLYLIYEKLSRCESLFPLIQSIVESNNEEKQIESLILFAAIITDRGFLAGQNREVFTCEGSQSKVTTVLSYIPTIEGEQCHIKCKKTALQLHSSLPYINQFNAMLDLFWKRCTRAC